MADQPTSQQKPAREKSTSSSPEPRDTIMVVGEDGNLYRIRKDDWYDRDHLVEDIAAVGVVSQLAAYGVYLAYIPDDIAAGNGVCCTMINLKKLLQENAPIETRPDAKQAR